MEAEQGENPEHWFGGVGCVATQLFCDTGLGCDLLSVVHGCDIYLSSRPCNDRGFRKYFLHL